jgi:hypothetical protein
MNGYRLLNFGSCKGSQVHVGPLLRVRQNFDQKNPMSLGGGVDMSLHREVEVLVRPKKVTISRGWGNGLT